MGFFARMAMKKKRKPKAEFINREISWLSFNERVLQEAQDSTVPLIERMRFLGIFANNLDEFFKVRVATLQRATGVSRKPIDPMDFDPDQTLEQVHAEVVKLQVKFENAFRKLLTELKSEGIHMVNESQLTPTQSEFVQHYFEETVRPTLVPLILNPKQDLPALKDNALYLAVQFSQRDGQQVYALTEVPQSLPRFVELPPQEGKRFFMFQDDVVRCGLGRVFSIFNASKFSAYAFKLTRDAELDLDSDLSKSLMEKMERSLERRKRGQFVRISFDKAIPQDFLQVLLRKTKIKEKENIIPGSRYHNKRDLMRFPHFGRTDLCFAPIEPLQHPHFKGKRSILEQIRKKDVLLHFPYHTFGHITDLLREAAIDPMVRTIRVSIYRVSKDSQVVNALLNAARNGKQVVVVVELQARFDEENNMQLVEQLQEAGARVIPGVPGLKVHSKLILISRREGARTVRYTHVGSGNFHERTARVYTDTSLLTANREIGREARKIFEFFESNFQRSIFRHLIVSPFGTRRKFTELIQEEIKNARKGRPAWITLKMNNMVDAGMIRKLYEASQAGVKVKCIIRGICSLIPGQKGLSDNIEVVSIVGRFLEHSRIYAFCNNNKPLYYLSSADWMTRNLDFRTEVSAPVLDPQLQNELNDLLQIQLSPNSKARLVEATHHNRFVAAQRHNQPDPQMAAYAYLKGKS